MLGIKKHQLPFEAPPHLGEPIGVVYQIIVYFVAYNIVKGL